jgi:archaellum component FlaC
MGFVNVPFILSIFKKKKEVEPSDERKEELKTMIEEKRKELEKLGASKEVIDKFLETANKTWNRFDNNK